MGQKNMETIYWTCGGVANLASIYSLQSYTSVNLNNSTIMIIQPCLITNVTLATTFLGAWLM